MKQLKKDVYLYHHLFLFLMVLTLSFSCQKDASNSTKTKSEILMSGTWHLNKIEDKCSNCSNWIPEKLLSCKNDDLLIFKTVNSYELNEGATKCDPRDPQIQDVGFWELYENDTKLRIFSTECIIETLDNNNLVFRYYSNGNPNSTQNRFTWIK